MQSPRQRRLTIPPPSNKLPPQSPQTRTPPNRQPPSQLLLYLPHLFHQLPISSQSCPRCPLPVAHRIHRASQEQPYRFVNVRFVCDGRQSEFCEGLSDANDGFELTDCDGDGATHICIFLGERDAVANGDEVGGQLFGGFAG